MAGPAVLLLGGFGLPVDLLRPLQRRLREQAVAVEIAPTGLTIDCAEVEAARVAQAASDLAERAETSVVLVGHSRGGQLALVTAVRRPELVAAVVTVGTPWRTGVPDIPVARAGAWVAGLARRVRLPVPGSLACGYADCCERFRADLARRPPVPWVALWSAADRVVRPAEARRDGARPVEVSGGHLTMILSSAGQAAICAAVAEEVGRRAS